MTHGHFELSQNVLKIKLLSKASGHNGQNNLIFNYSTPFFLTVVKKIKKYACI